MKIYSVYKLDNKDNSIEIKNKYTIESVAKNGVLNVALEYIKEQYGQSHVNACNMIGKTVQQINSDDSIKSGCYLIKKRDNIIVVSKDKYEEYEQITRQIITPIKKIISYPEEIEITLVEEVPKTIITSTIDTISYLASFIMSPTVTEKSEEVLVEEQVTKKINIYSEKEVVVDEIEYVKEYEKRKVFKTIPICEFGLLEFEVDEPQSYSATFTQDSSKIKEKENLTAIKTIKAAYIGELTDLLKSGSLGLRKI